VITVGPRSGQSCFISSIVTATLFSFSFFYVDNPGVHTLLDLISFVFGLSSIIGVKTDVWFCLGERFAAMMWWWCFWTRVRTDYIFLCIYRYSLLRPVGVFVTRERGGTNRELEI